MKKAIYLLFILFALLPGLLILSVELFGGTLIRSSQYYIPYEHNKFFGIGILFIGLITLLTVNLWWERLRVFNFLQVRNSILFLIALTVSSLVVYSFLFSTFTSRDTDDIDDVLFPFLNIVEFDKYSAEGEYDKEFRKALFEDGKDAIQKDINASSSYVPEITSATFFFFYQLIFTSLAGAFGILGIYTDQVENEIKIEGLKIEIGGIRLSNNEIKDLQRNETDLTDKERLEKILKGYQEEQLKRLELIGRLRQRKEFVTNIEVEFELEMQIAKQNEGRNKLNIEINEIQEKIANLAN